MSYNFEKSIQNNTLHHAYIIEGSYSVDKDEYAKDKVMHKVIHHDLVKFGLIPELVGRLPVITCLEAMDKDTLIRIMTEPKNSIIKQYQALFSLDNIKLEFEKEALEKIAELEKAGKIKAVITQNIDGLHISSAKTLAHKSCISSSLIFPTDS